MSQSRAFYLYFLTIGYGNLRVTGTLRTYYSPALKKCEPCFEKVGALLDLGCLSFHHSVIPPGCVAQSVTCLATDVSLTANPGVSSSISARSHTLVEIDHEIISTVILLPSTKSLKKGCCQLKAKVCALSTG